LQNENSKHQKSNFKRFDKLTTLSPVEGQIPITKFKIPNKKSAECAKRKIDGSTSFAKRYNTTAMNVSVIGN
jgi:hypothetical protein